MICIHTNEKSLEEDWMWQIAAAKVLYTLTCIYKKATYNHTKEESVEDVKWGKVLRQETYIHSPIFTQKRPIYTRRRKVWKKIGLGKVLRQETYIRSPLFTQTKPIYTRKRKVRKMLDGVKCCGKRPGYTPLYLHKRGPYTHKRGKCGRCWMG